MPLSRTRDYLSIGEVLESIKAEFPDVSISKIRFLEAEGLISPERTGSGYRKFFEADVARLRFILGLQRDQFLPLKVIRERLGEVDSNGAGYPEPAGSAPAPAPARRGAKEKPAAAATDVSLNRADLCKAAGLSEAQLADLEDFGLLGSDSGTYDGNDLTVATAARKMFEFGLEPRHLRIYRQWAEREAALFEQIVSPVMRRRDPSSADHAHRAVVELMDCSRRLREATLRASLRSML